MHSGTWPETDNKDEPFLLHLMWPYLTICRLDSTCDEPLVVDVFILNSCLYTSWPMVRLKSEVLSILVRGVKWLPSNWLRSCSVEEWLTDISEPLVANLFFYSHTREPADLFIFSLKATSLSGLGIMTKLVRSILWTSSPWSRSHTWMAISLLSFLSLSCLSSRDSSESLTLRLSYLMQSPFS